jgi:tetratricopeptide (TPR) repeat protein
VLGLVCLFVQTGDVPAVVAATTKGLSMQADHIKCLLLRATAYRAQGLLDESLQDINRAALCGRAPEGPEVDRSTLDTNDEGTMTVGALFARNNARSRSSTPAVGDDDPDVIRQRNLTLNAIAIRHRMHGRYADAVALFDQVIESEPDCVQFVINRADARLEAEDYLNVPLCGDLGSQSFPRLSVVCV